MAETNTSTRVNIEGGVSGGAFTGFPEGVDSFSHPMAVKPTQVRWLENAVTQGGFIQTRPGLKTRLEFDLTDVTGPFYQWWIVNGKPVIHPQMMADFKPSNGPPQKVFAVSGSVWFCQINVDGSLGEPQRIPTFQFCATADQLTATPCVQTSTIVSGVYANNIVPRNLLVIQDGINRAGIWDGLIGVTANPVKKVSVDVNGDTLFDAGWNQTLIGLWCCWSGNRLFVFNGRTGRASDLGDPTHFTEELQLNSLPVIVFPEDVTGAIDRGTSGNNQSTAVVCTRTTTWTIYTGIQNRLPSAYGPGWANDPDFITKIFSSVGCVAGKSMIVHLGIIYWRSLEGIVLFDSVNTVNSTQNIPPVDNEMAYSKRLIAPPNNPSGDLTCAGRRGSYVFWSVPVGSVTNGRCYCRHTQVLDRQTTVVRSIGLDGPFSYGTTGWQGIWTGIRPVEWSNVQVAAEHVYAISMDGDGVVRIWEAFQGNRSDNGMPIPWIVETRTSQVQQSVFEYANFRAFRLLLDQVVGNLEVSGSWRGMRGLYKQIVDTKITATPGSVLAPVAPFDTITNNSPQYAFVPQNRTLLSPDVRGSNDECQSAGVESQYEDGVDHAFSLLLNFLGRGALVGYRISVDSRADTTEGTAELPTGICEDGFNIVSAAECPQHIDGVTPDYILEDQPNQLALCPYQPVFDESSIYDAPPPPSPVIPVGQLALFSGVGWFTFAGLPIFEF